MGSCETANFWRNLEYNIIREFTGVKFMIYAKQTYNRLIHFCAVHFHEANLNVSKVLFGKVSSSLVDWNILTFYDWISFAEMLPWAKLYFSLRYVDNHTEKTSYICSKFSALILNVHWFFIKLHLNSSWHELPDMYSIYKVRKFRKML